jgi:membrane dipeptidase
MSIIDRRTFIGHCAALTIFVTTARAKAGPPDVSAVYRRSVVLDTLSFASPDFDPSLAVEAGLTGVVLDIHATPRDPDHAVTALDAWNKAFAAPGSPFRCVLKAADIVEAKRLGEFAVILNCQDASILGVPSLSNSSNNIDTLRMLYGKGLRILQLTYTNNNGLGTGYSDAYEAGLTRLGMTVVTEMNRLGMLIDTSHCSEMTTLDAIRHSSRPIAVTHAGCYSLFKDKRNKSDEVIRDLADKGGYMGIYNMTLWMTANSTSSVDTIVDHIDHAVKVGGIDLVGFGSDHEVMGDYRPRAVKIAEMQRFADRNKGWPGGEPVHGHVTADGMDGPDRLHVLADALGRRGYRDGAIEKILGANFIRVFRAACG